MFGILAIQLETQLEMLARKAIKADQLLKREGELESEKVI